MRGFSRKELKQGGKKKDEWVVVHGFSVIKEGRNLILVEFSDEYIHIIFRIAQKHQYVPVTQFLRFYGKYNPPRDFIRFSGGIGSGQYMDILRRNRSGCGIRGCQTVTGKLTHARRMETGSLGQRGTI